ncbi:MAG: PAS domain S-box protein, partial [Deltaproteobacteria bacterium]|nr:PAS domain S-box protein [Deltaproteobacteria bacterium]
MNRQLFFRIGKKDRPEIIEVRHRFFNWVMYPFLIFGLLATILGGLQSYQQGRWVFSVLYAACYLIFGFTTFLGRYISLFIRSIVTIMTLVAFSILILLRIGLSGIGLEVLLLACGISSALLGRRIGYVITSIGVLAMLVIGGSMVSGMLPIWEETMLTSLSPLAWGTSIIVFLMSGLALVTLPQMFLGRLEESLTLLEERAGELERSNVSMKKTIEAREKAEKALKESEEKYRILVENAGDAIFIAQNGLLRFVNNKATELSGRTHDELISKNFNDIIHKEDRELVIERHKKRQQGIEVPSNYSFRIINKSGDVKWVELNAVRIEW